MRAGVPGVVLVVLSVLYACGDGSTDSATSASGDATAPAAQPDSAAAPAAATASVVEDVAYRQSGDDEVSTVDVYVGDRSEGGPVVVLLHEFGRSGPGRPDADLGALGRRIAENGATVLYFGWQSRFGFSADSVADLSCVGPFVAARAAEFGADPDNVVVVGHSMGAEAGSMLAFTAFDLAPSDDCVETGQPSDPVAFVGIGGAYGMVGGPIDDDHTRFRVKTFPNGRLDEFDADEDVLDGLTAAQLYRLDGYSAMPPPPQLEIVLVVGSDDQYPATNAGITVAFGEALEAANAAVEVVTIDGANHEDVVDPTTEPGQATLEVIADTQRGFDR